MPRCQAEGGLAMGCSPASLARLRPGMLVRFAHEVHRVVLVNECRAKIVPVARRTVVVQTAGGKRVQFQREERGHNISTESELEVVG